MLKRLSGLPTYAKGGVAHYAAGGPTFGEIMAAKMAAQAASPAPVAKAAAPVAKAAAPVAPTAAGALALLKSGDSAGALQALKSSAATPAATTDYSPIVTPAPVAAARAEYAARSALPAQFQGMDQQQLAAADTAIRSNVPTGTSPTGFDPIKDTVSNMYIQQLGRAPDAAGLEYYTNQIKTGALTPESLAAQLDRSTEGYNYDAERIASQYRSTFGRDPDQEGFQFYMGLEDQNPTEPAAINNAIKVGALTGSADAVAAAAKPQGYTTLQTTALTADPYAGRYATDNPYYFGDIPADAVNRSVTQAGQSIQFTNPVTGQPMITTVDPKTGFTVTAGNNVLQRENVQNAIDLAVKSGALSMTDAASLTAKIANADAFKTATGTTDPTFNNLYALLSDPKASVILGDLGIQIGEDADKTNALAESVERQELATLAGKDLGGLAPSTRTIAEVAASTGKSYPFTEANLGLGKISTKATEADIYKNLGTELGITADPTKVVTPTYLDTTVGGGGNDTYPADQTTWAGGYEKPDWMKNITPSIGDFRPKGAMAADSEIPAMLRGAESLSISSPGSGIQKGLYGAPVTTPTVDNKIDPLTGALLGGAAGYLFGNQASNKAAYDSAGNLIKGAYDLVTGGSSGYNPFEGASTSDIAGAFGKKSSSASVDDFLTTFGKDGGLATPLMKDGGGVQNYDVGGVVSDIGNILTSGAGKGAALGALFSNLLSNYSSGQGVNKGLDMSKVGYIAPRTTQMGPARYVPYSQYGVPTTYTPTAAETANLGGLGQARMTSGLGGTSPYQPFLRTAAQKYTPVDYSLQQTSKDGGDVHMADGGMPGFAPQRMPPQIGNQNMPPQLGMPTQAMQPQGMPPQGMQQPMQQQQAMQPVAQQAQQPASYYTYGNPVKPSDMLQGMAQGGLPTQMHQPMTEGRNDYRAGSRVTGAGDGQSDDIPAMLADGEYVFDADTVAQLGNGSTKAGSDLLDKFREELRAHKRSAPVNKIPPPSKSPLAYLKAAREKQRG